MAREDAGLRLEDLAEELEVSRWTLTKWERDWDDNSPKAPRPKKVFIEKIAELTHVPVEWLTEAPSGSPDPTGTRYVANRTPVEASTGSAKTNCDYPEYTPTDRTPVRAAA